MPTKESNTTTEKQGVWLKCPKCKKLQVSILLNDPDKDDHMDEYWRGTECGHSWWYEGLDY